MNKTVARSLNGSHVNHVIESKDVTGWLGEPFYSAIITNIMHKRDGSVTLHLTIPVHHQDQRGMKNFMAAGHTWIHHMYLNGEDEVEIRP